MKTIYKVVREYPEHTKLIKAVIQKIGTESIQDVIQHGADSGFTGFIYYSDTRKFALEYRSEIIALLYDLADRLGEDIVNMIKNFGFFRKNPMTRNEEKDLFLYLGNGEPDDDKILNLMAWFALEEVCYMFDE